MLLLKTSYEITIAYLFSLHPERYDKKNTVIIEMTLKRYK